jgi:thiosulfate dehydrogenase (quinone) large subunit
MYLMMWSVALLPTTNPVIDDHILGAAAMAVLGLTLAGDTWGFGKAWSRLHLVEKNQVLR